MLNSDPGHRPSAQPALATKDRSGVPNAIALLTERQRAYLRPVLRNRTSKEIAAATGSSHRAAGNQLLEARNLLGVPARFDATRLLVGHEAGWSLCAL